MKPEPLHELAVPDALDDKPVGCGIDAAISHDEPEPDNIYAGSFTNLEEWL